MKVLHLSCVRELTPGQRKQLSYELDSALDLNLDWHVLAFHNGEIKDSRFEKNIPYFFKGLFLRNLYAWIYLIKNQHKYDLIVNRHMLFDPFVLVFGWLIKKRVSLHHAKEVESLKVIKKGLKGEIASFFEKITGTINLLQVKAIVSVTNDIAKYQTIKKEKLASFIYPNGIELSKTKIVKDLRDDESINIAFMCGTFSPWHGLDLLINEIVNNIEKMDRHNVKIHLIGNILNEELAAISKNKLEKYIYTYGRLSSTEYIKILENCDIALDSLALYREGLLEGAALKVREYLAFGLPVFSAYKDTAIPNNFFFYNVSSVSLIEIIKYSIEMKSISRQEVRSSAEMYISKKFILEKLNNDLKNLFNDKI